MPKSKKRRIKPFNPIQNFVGSFLLMIAFGTVLLALPWSSSDGKSLPLLDSIFTSTSAVCVTGLIVRDTPAYFSTFGEIVILLLLQAGGIGILTYTSLFGVLMGRRIRYKNLNLIKESFGAMSGHSVLDLLKLVILFTFTIEIVGALLLIPVFAKDASGLRMIYLAVFHSVSAFCNAGFSLFSDSFISFKGNYLLNFVICSLIIIGGIGFPVIADVWNSRRYTKLSAHSKLVIRITLWLIVIGWGLIYLFEGHTNPYFWRMSAPERLMSALFQSITARTAGFNTLDIGLMGTPALIVLICLMFIGGSPGGTAGGIKTTTFAVAAKSGFVFLTGKREVNIGGRRVSQASQFRAQGLAFFAVMVLVVAMMLLTALSGMSLLNAAFEAASAFGTVGLSTGVTSGLNSLQKVVIIVLMFVGRVGPVSLALSLGFREKGELAHRPEIDVLTG